MTKMRSKVNDFSVSVCRLAQLYASVGHQLLEEVHESLRRNNVINRNPFRIGGVNIIPSIIQYLLHKLFIGSWQQESKSKIMTLAKIRPAV
jgi:hypothetical protein